MLKEHKMHIYSCLLCYTAKRFQCAGNIIHEENRYNVYWKTSWKAKLMRGGNGS